MAIEVLLPGGRTALIDDADAPEILRYSWYVNSKGYAERSAGRRRKVIMHRQLMEGCTAPEIDHVNGNKLDNRRVNLRGVTASQNQMNKGKQPNCTSRYKGVSWNKAARKWMARITKDGSTRYLGSFESEREAARIYNKAARELFGEYARLNPLYDG